MQNHAEKRRDMCRSILPSTARVRARDELARAKRRHRRQVRQNLGDCLLWEWEDYEGHLTDDTNRVEHGASWDLSMKWIVADRRNSDKVAPLRRWVEANKDRLPGDDDEAKWAALKTWLPDNLIGRHARSHVEDLFDLPDRWDRFRRYYPTETIEERKARWAAERAEFAALVRTAVETRHAEFNDAWCGDPCHGLHDVERWANSRWRDEGAKTIILKILGRTL